MLFQTNETTSWTNSHFWSIVSLPTYQEVTKTINKIKSIGSPYPHDHMSIIMLKRCPFLRTALQRIISHRWENQTFTKTSEYEFTILIGKKGYKKVPSNFRPITLQPVFAKVYSSLIPNWVNRFLLENNNINSKIQKVFWSDVFGVIEHIELFNCIINHAMGKKHQAIITFIDLQNAFGEGGTGNYSTETILYVREYYSIQIDEWRNVY